VIGDEPGNTREDPDPSEEALSQGEGGAGIRFYLLYDKICRDDILARTNGGAPGVDGESFAAIEAAGLEEWLAGIRKDLAVRTYRPAPVVGRQHKLTPWRHEELTPSG
jgi:RNA-directed DNA polymerase